MSFTEEQKAAFGFLKSLGETRKLYTYRPYPKQFFFHKAGAEYRERLLQKGNRLGGTLCGAFEVSLHATGEYPDWWPGRRYDRPVLIWIGSESTSSQREIIQQTLFGCQETNVKHPRMGTGTLPRDRIVKVTNRQAGVRDVMDKATIRHVSGGESTIAFKTYEQGRLVLQGARVDVCWPDEEPKHDPAIYSEMLARTQDVPDGMIFMTFTPLNGRTPIVDKFLSPNPGDSPKSVTKMTIWDAVGGEWPGGTPWAGQKWEGHISRARAEEIIASYHEYERETRAYGEPMAGEGRVFEVAEQRIRVDPFELPRHWARINAIDFGIDHPFAASALAHDRDTDTVYVYKCYRTKGETPAIHVPALRAWGDWIPVAWPHDGVQRDKGSGIELHHIYRRHGLNLLPRSARYDEKTSGGQPVEPIVTTICERMLQGRFKVFANLSDWFDEFRGLHRKNGVIVPLRDDILKSTFYAMIDLRRAMPEMLSQRRPHRAYERPIVEMGW